jgi:glycosyltransferase involved in cell wall biosynthesis
MLLGELRVASCPLTEHDRPWNFDKSLAPFEIDLPFEKTRSRTPWDLYSTASTYLDRHDPDVLVVIGYGSKLLLAFAAAAQRRDIPCVLRLAHVLDISRSTLSRELAKQLVCRSLFDAVVVPGVRSAKYARVVGFSPRQIWRIGNVVDNAHFTREEQMRTPSETFTYVGRLSKEKNLARLLRAFDRYRDRGGRWSLRIVGDGPDAESLRELGSTIEGVTFTGWAAYEDVPGELHRSSAFVLPSLFEPWGLVANEAMAASLPVLISRRCGCYPELCRDGGNGLGFDPESIKDISTAFERMSEFTVARRRAMGKLSRSIVRSYTPETWAHSLLNCFCDLAS